jgi:vanillate O-demethylase ferredoxin subunit
MLAMPSPTLSLQIAELKPVGGGIVLLDLRNADGSNLPAFEAGAHVDLHLPGALVRQYSLYNDPAERHRYGLAVRLIEDGRGGSRAAHGLKAGDDVHVGLPRNLFTLNEAARHSILLAAGIGVTPLLAMAHRLAAIGASFELHFRCGEPDHGLIEPIRNSRWRERATVSVSGEASPDYTAMLREAKAETHLYVCGPARFTDMIQQAASHWPRGTIHTESFRPAVARTGDEAFRVQTARDGAWHQVPPDRSIVEVLANAGYVVPTSCEQGICGTCRTGVLAGTPDHRDMCLTPAQQAANALITPCCSRALTEHLVLDL